MTQIQKKHDLLEEEDIDIFQIDLEPTERQEELDILDRKCEDWVNTKTEEK